MAEFATPIDIANRALQHVGVGSLNRIAAFTDASREASEVAFVYDKVRRAELRRNVWRFAIRRAALRPVDTTTLLMVPGAWSATIAYPVGAIVQDSSGEFWINTTPFNVDHTPGADDFWEVYFGPLTCAPYDATVAYYAGEMVYEDNGAGTVEVFSALTEGTSAEPSTADVWDAAVTYNKGQVVTDNSYFYISLADQNLDQAPTAYDMWQSTCTYAKGDIIGATDGKLYVSLTASNTGNKPQTDSLLYNPNTTNFGGAHWAATGGLLAWTANFISSAAENNWVAQSFGGVKDLNIVYPLGAGPSSQAATRNVFRLPNGFLRQAPQDPKAGSNSFLGAPSGRRYDDWEFEGNYLVSRETGTIVFRFVADITLVTQMDDMFCEGLGARIGIEICEPLTQSAEKLTKIEGAYTKFMTEARTVNGIETGPVEPAEDDFVACRI